MNLLALVFLLAVSANQPTRMTDYAVELAELDQRLEAADDAERLHLLYTRASLTGDLAEWLSFRQMASEGAKDSPSAEALLYLASACVELHKLDDAEAALDRLSREFPGFAAANTSYPNLLRADVKQQRGQTEDARSTYNSLLAQERTWDRLARVAYDERRAGHYRSADKLYAEAQEPLSVKEMRRWAWLELQRGLVDLDRAKYDQALEHFQRADRAYSGYWLIEEHLAEVLATMGRVAEAIAIYRRVVTESSRPEYLAALAALLATRNPEESNRLDRLAMERFEHSFERAPEAVAGTFADYLLKYHPDDPRITELADPTTVLSSDYPYLMK